MNRPRPLWQALRGELTVSKGAFLLLVLIIVANLSALADLLLHPEIPYLDIEHLVVGGVYAVFVCGLFLLVAIYIGKDEEITRLNAALEIRIAELEEARRLAEIANQAKTDFLANMSHEMTTPLNSVIGFSQILQDELCGPLNEKQKEYVADVESSGQRLLGLVRNMLDLARAISGSLALDYRHFAVREAVQSVIGAFHETARERQQQISFDLQPGADREIEADADKFRQILFNLLDNALKFTPEGGRIRITGRPADHMALAPRFPREDLDHPPALEIAITDTGIGIAAADLPRLFREVI